MANEDPPSGQSPNTLGNDDPDDAFQRLQDKLARDRQDSEREAEQHRANAEDDWDNNPGPPPDANSLADTQTQVSADQDEAFTPDGAVRTTPQNSLGTPIQISSENCGRAVIQGMIRDASDGATFVKERDLLSGQTGGTDPDTLADELRRFGATAKVYDDVSVGNVQTMLNSGQQVAVGLKTGMPDGHWVRVDTIKDGLVYYGDPYTGATYHMTMPEFNAVMESHGVVSASWPSGVQLPPPELGALNFSLIRQEIEKDHVKFLPGEEFDTTGKVAGDWQLKVIGNPTDTARLDDEKLAQKHQDMVREAQAAKAYAQRTDVTKVNWGDSAEQWVKETLGKKGRTKAPDVIAFGKDGDQTVVHLAEGKGDSLYKALKQFEEAAKAADKKGWRLGEVTIVVEQKVIDQINQRSETAFLRVDPETGILLTQPYDEVTQTRGAWEPKVYWDELNGRDENGLLVGKERVPVRIVAAQSATGVRAGVPQVLRNSGRPRRMGTPVVSDAPIPGVGLSDEVSETLHKLGVQEKVLVIRDLDSAKLKIYNAAGELVHETKFIPTSRTSVQRAVRWFARTSQGITPQTLQKIMGVLETAGRLLFILDALRTLREMADPETRIQLLREYSGVLRTAAHAAQSGQWEQTGIDLVAWSHKMAELGGPFTSAGGGFFIYLQDHWMSTFFAERMSLLPPEYLMYLARKTLDIANRMEWELHHREDVGQTVYVTADTSGSGTLRSDQPRPVEPPPVEHIQFRPRPDFSKLSQAELQAAIDKGAEDVAHLKTELKECEEYFAYLDRWEGDLREAYPTADANNGSEFERSDKEQIEYELHYIEEARAMTRRRCGGFATALQTEQEDLVGLVTESLNRYGEGGSRRLVEDGKPTVWDLPFPAFLVPDIADEAVELATASEAGKSGLIKIGAAVALIVLASFGVYQLVGRGSGNSDQQSSSAAGASRQASVLQFVETNTATPAPVVNLTPSVLQYLGPEATATAEAPSVEDASPDNVDQSGGDAANQTGNSSAEANTASSSSVLQYAEPPQPSSGQADTVSSQPSAYALTGPVTNTLLSSAGAACGGSEAIGQTAQGPLTLTMTPRADGNFDVVSSYGETGIYYPDTGVLQLSLNVNPPSTGWASELHQADWALTSAGVLTGHAVRTLTAPDGRQCIDTFNTTGQLEQDAGTSGSTSQTADSPPAPAQPPASNSDPTKDSITEALQGPYAAAVREADGDALIAYDSNVAFDYYGMDRCLEHFGNVDPDPTFDISVTGNIAGPDLWTWVYQGATIGDDIPNVYSIPAEVTQRGQTVAAVIHATWDGGLKVFSPC